MRAVVIACLLLLLSSCAIQNSSVVLPSHKKSGKSDNTVKPKSTTKPKATAKKQAKAKTMTPKKSKRTSKRPKKAEKSLSAVAQAYVGVRYKFGGTTRSGLDCSGFIYRVQHDMGNRNYKRVPTKVMVGQGKGVKRSSLQVGDLCFFGPRKRVNHVGIYLGNNRFIHASSSQGVTITSLDNVYWKPRIISFRRVRW